MNTTTRKSRGFTGERIMEIPNETVEKCRQMPLINGFFITRMGFYPRALHHYYQRPSGISQVILLYCTDGQGWIQLPKGQVILRAGDVFAIAPGTPHSYGADTENPWSIHWFHFSGDQCQEAVRAIMPEKEGSPQAVRVEFVDERIAYLTRYSTRF